jgi:formate hydrogenlyase subunit 7
LARQRSDLIQVKPRNSQHVELEDRLRTRIDQLFGRSLHIRHVDAGSCNACESEIKLLTSPYYDLHRLGMFFTPSPRHADVLLVTGPVTRAMEGPLKRTYEAMPDPRLVVAVGTCACGGGVFGPSAYEYGALAAVLPVDAFIPGCPPTPIALIYGLLLALDRVEQRLVDGFWVATAPSAVNTSVPPEGDGKPHQPLGTSLLENRGEKRAETGRGGTRG